MKDPNSSTVTAAHDNVDSVQFICYSYKYMYVFMHKVLFFFAMNTQFTLIIGTFHGLCFTVGGR